MRDNLPQKPKAFISDLNDFDKNERSLHMSVSAKNLDRLKELSIENLWLVGANEKELRKILPLVNLKYLNLYQVLAKDLTILETLDKTETIILNWNTKSSSLWDISKNKELKTLEITDFSKLEEIDQLSLATQISDLILGGGHEKPWKIKSINPLKNLTNLKALSLTNLKIGDDTLRPLGHLKNIETLFLSNQFETREYAWLATRLTKTKCEMFQATNSCNIFGSDNKLVWDTMITGRRKSFLLSTNDQVKIDKYIKDFEILKDELAE
jgi:Leucine-rich repeat (LRR) protein